jgi:GAF domain-containing protein
MTKDQRVRAGLPEGLSRRLQDALEQGSSASKGLLRLVLDAAKESLSGQAAVVLTPVNDHNLQFFQATDERFLADDFPKVPIASSIAGFVYLSGQTIALDNARESSRHYAEVDEKSGFVTVEYLAVPIVQEDSVLGVLTVANRGAGQGPFSLNEIDLAALYADLCALLLMYEGSLGQQIAATREELRHLFFEAQGGATPGAGPTAPPGWERATEQLRARLNLALRELPHSDLELIYDLAARLTQTSAANKA